MTDPKEALERLKSSLSKEFHGLGHMRTSVASDDLRVLIAEREGLEAMHRDMCGVAGRAIERAEAAESKLSALEEAVREACDLLAERAYGSAARSPGHNARVRLESALLHPTVPVEPACAHQWFGKTSRAGQRWQCSLCCKVTDQDPAALSPVPPSRGADHIGDANELMAQPHPDVTGLVEALRKIKASSVLGSWFWNEANDALASHQEENP